MALGSMWLLGAGTSFSFADYLSGNPLLCPFPHWRGSEGESLSCLACRKKAGRMSLEFSRAGHPRHPKWLQILVASGRRSVPGTLGFCRKVRLHDAIPSCPQHVGETHGVSSCSLAQPSDHALGAKHFCAWVCDLSVSPTPSLWREKNVKNDPQEQGNIWPEVAPHPGPPGNHNVRKFRCSFHAGHLNLSERKVAWPRENRLCEGSIWEVAERHFWYFETWGGFNGGLLRLTCLVLTAGTCRGWQRHVMAFEMSRICRVPSRAGSKSDSRSESKDCVRQKVGLGSVWCL